MKTCTNCKAEHEATLENFYSDKRSLDGLTSQCKVCRRDTMLRHYATISGDLTVKFNAMNKRCSKRKTYAEKGIKNKFKSLEHFRSYVVEVLKVDPRGLVCHRINDDEHYREGNIQFITKSEHDKIHGG